MLIEKIQKGSKPRRPSVAQVIPRGAGLTMTEGYVGTGHWVIKREVATPEVLKRLDVVEAKGWNNYKPMKTEARVQELMNQQAQHYEDPNKTEFIPTHEGDGRAVMARDGDNVVIDDNFYLYMTRKLKLKIVLSTGIWSPLSLYKGDDLVGLLMPMLVRELELEGVV